MQKNSCTKGLCNLILKAFAVELQKHPEVEPCVFLQQWLHEILLKTPENHVENVIHTEFFLQTTQDGVSIVSSNSKNNKSNAMKILQVD